MTNYFNIKAQYDLAQSGSLAVYEGIGFNEDDYKDIQSLAGSSGGSGFGFGFGDRKDTSGTAALDITNFLGALSKTALRDQPTIKRKQTKINVLPAAAPRSRINISSLVLPNRVPTFKVSNSKK